mgnify:CR=1 FL=1
MIRKLIAMSRSWLGLAADVFALICGVVALLIGWMGYGGYIFGVPAILLGAYRYKKAGGVLPILSIVFGSIGAVESFVVGHIVVPAIEKALNETVEELNKSMEKLEEQLGIKEKTITLPYVIEGEKGLKLRINSITLRKSNLVASNYSYYSFFYEEEITKYMVYSPRPGFTFYLLEYEVENIGSKKVDPIDFEYPRGFELITDQNNTYEPLSFSEMSGKWHVIVTNETNYSKYVCEKSFETLYPGDKAKSCIFFEVRETETPVMVKFSAWLSMWPSTYYYVFPRH